MSDTRGTIEYLYAVLGELILPKREPEPESQPEMPSMIEMIDDYYDWLDEQRRQAPIKKRREQFARRERRLDQLANLLRSQPDLTISEGAEMIDQLYYPEAWFDAEGNLKTIPEGDA